MNYLWVKFERGDFLKEINFSLFIITVLISFFAFTECLTDRSNLWAENERVLLAGYEKAGSIITNHKLHIDQQVSVTGPVNWYIKGTITGFLEGSGLLESCEEL
jgi:hypothetical protein